MASVLAVDNEVFERRFLAHAASQLAGREDDALSALATAAYAFGASRARAETLVRVTPIDAETTAVELVTADAPYLVDSVRAELTRSRAHPAPPVGRDP
jgi:glutamate dehydrogenase